MNPFYTVHAVVTSAVVILMAVWIVRALIGKGLFVAGAGHLRRKDSPGMFIIMLVAYVVILGFAATWLCNDIRILIGY